MLFLKTSGKSTVYAQGHLHPMQHLLQQSQKFTDKLQLQEFLRNIAVFSSKKNPFLLMWVKTNTPLSY